MSNNLLYCTAIIKSTKRVSSDELLIELEKLEELTNTEEGCISFQIFPMSSEYDLFSIWEVWQDETGFYEHHNMEYTKGFFSKKLTEITVFESSRKVEV